MPDEKTIEPDAVVEFTTREEYVTLACKAIDTIVAMRVDMDEKLMSKQDQARLKNIISNAIAVIDSNVQDMYNEHFENEED